jgi:predicted MFS family arabinose efflux permease
LPDLQVLKSYMHAQKAERSLTQKGLRTFGAAMSKVLNNSRELSGASIIRAIAAGLCSSLVGIGLSRFAFSPLIPPLVSEHWFAASQAAYLGAANLMGYVVGALVSLNLARAIPVRPLLRAMMLVATASFFASGYPLPFLWFFAWRFAAGCAGGVLMVAGTAAALEQIPPKRRGLAAGIVIGGVGAGIIASGTLVPFLLAWGLSETWFGLGILSLVLTAAAWRLWPPLRPAQIQPSSLLSDRRLRPDRSLRTVYAASALTALGLVPYFIFVVDFIARGLNAGIAAGAHVWIATGIGALFGAALIGYVGDRIGFKRAFRWSYVVEALAIGLFAFTGDQSVLLMASIVIGAFISAIVPLVIGRLQEIMPKDSAAQKAAWRTATTAFGIGQAAAGYVYSFIFSQTGGDYRLLFLLGALSFLIALAIDVQANADIVRKSASQYHFFASNRRNL